MKLEDLQIYTSNKKPPHNFKNMVGYENDNFRVVSRAPNGKNYTVQWNC